MARSASVAVSSSRDPVDPVARDVARFHDFLQHGSPGPHSYAVLLGLEAFDAPELLRSITRGFPYRTLERFQRNTSLPLDRITDLVDIPRRTLTRRKGEGRFLPKSPTGCSARRGCSGWRSRCSKAIAGPRPTG